MVARNQRMDLPESGTNGVYRIILSSGYFYIGSSSNIRSRIIHHLAMLRDNQHFNKKLQEQFNLQNEYSITYFVSNDRNSAYREEMNEIGNNLDNYFMCNEISDHRPLWDLGHSDQANEKRNATVRSVEFVEARSKGTKNQWENTNLREKRMVHLSKPEVRAQLIKNLTSLESRAKSKAILNSPETKAKASASKKKMWEDPSYREKVLTARASPEALAKRAAKSKPVIVNGVEYQSTRIACETLNLNISTLQSKLAKGTDPNVQYKPRE
jgi:hypothetical protein